MRASSTNDGSEDGERTIIRKTNDGWKINYSGEKPETPLLDTINYPLHMKNLSIQVNHLYIFESVNLKHK